MTALQIRFTSSRYKKITLEAQIKGDANSRCYVVVPNLCGLSLDYWDKELQEFRLASSEAITNNQILKAFIAPLQEAINSGMVTSVAEVCAMAKGAHKVVAHKVMTLGAYLDLIIIRFGNGQRLNGDTIKPSRNYVNYKTLKSKLMQEGCIINTPISEVGDDEVEAFSNYVKKKLNGKNYTNILKTLCATVHKAYAQKLSDVVLRFKLSDHAPIKDDEADVHALTLEQYHTFEQYDTKTLPVLRAKSARRYELFHDICIFFYEMKLRPCDIIALRSENVADNWLSYTPIKKRNTRSFHKKVVAKLTPKAMAIIEKYKGVSAGGYVFPLEMNNKKWNLDNNTAYKQWCGLEDTARKQINRFLKLFEPILDIDCITMYTLRHSTFTHAVKANNKPYMEIAKEGGTSVDVIEKHYYSQKA